MPEGDFEAEILENEIVVAHVAEGHVYHFPILTNGTVSLHGSRIEPNPQSKREARRFLFDAHNAARAAFGRTTINRDVLMYFAGQDGVHACCVRDVTNQGAGLRLNGLIMVPSEFGISFDNFRTMRRCRLIWRDGDFVGASFQS
jgi:hypothetical protein